MCCMMFGCNSQINFCHFFHASNLTFFGSTSTKHIDTGYGKCSKISNTLKLRTPKIIAENNF